jgi:lysozyme family protein
MPELTDDFPRAAALVLPIEGLHSDDPNDPGGDTWYGIARADHPDAPWPPTRDQALAIYRAQYWDANGCGSLPWPVSLAVFDADVNQGDVPGAIVLQQALGVAEDGRIGPVTLAAAAARDPIDLAARVFAKRDERYMRSSGFANYGEGWLYRVSYIALQALAPASKG